MSEVNKDLSMIYALKEALWQMKRMSHILTENKINGALCDTDNPIVRIEEALRKAGTL